MSVLNFNGLVISFCNENQKVLFLSLKKYLGEKIIKYHFRSDEKTIKTKVSKKESGCEYWVF